MRFDRVRLENFKCYGDADLRLEAGVTVIHGLNGSGKSSLLEACFFALYGTKALDRTLDEVVTIGADEATVELWFTHAGEDYHVRRRIRVRDERALTAECVLEGPTGTFEGAKDVRARVTELLRMDAEAFVNCAYVRQGEVNKLINASPDERQDMLDDLLQLGVLEDYRERASDARVGVGRVRDDKRGALTQLDEQIEEKEAKDLHERRNELQTELADIAEDVERYEQQRQTAVETRDQAVAILEEYEEKREELERLEEDVGDLREQIAETEQEREELAETIQKRRDHREATQEKVAETLTETDLKEADPEAIADRRDTLDADREERREAIKERSVEKQEHESTAESHRETAQDLAERAESKREEADDLEEEVAETRESLAEKREELAELDEQITEIRESFEEAPVDVGDAAEFRETASEELSEQRETVTELRTTIEQERESLEEAKALREEGKCPECGQDVEGSPHVDTIEEDEARIANLEDDLAEAQAEQERLEDRLETADTLVERENRLRQREQNRENVARLLEDRESTLEEKAERVETLREEADDLDERAEEKREAAAEAEEAAEECRKAIGEHNRKQAELNQAIERLDDLADLVERQDDLGEEIVRLREQRETKGETNDERRERLADKRERKQELAEEFDESRIEEAEGEKERAEKYIEDVDEALDELRERRSDLQSQVGAITNEIEELEGLRERREELATTLSDLEGLYDEAEELQEMYGTLRAELRRRNVESLERMVNETFDLVYENDSYSHIELDGEYRLTVYQKDGEALDPDQLSGGERALFNLSLRCAIYRLLAEGIEGAAPMPPLILDEPTVFLDSGHVSQLVELVEAMRDMGVEQILVVSHDEELVGAADDLVTVKKDATSNRSTVERVVGSAEGLRVEMESD